ncbi:MAG: hypothetical protein EXS31_12310 [Pedosphaera sp.]|nr:hypothetical protein [Pedosphaera sp.]
MNTTQSKLSFLKNFPLRQPTPGAGALGNRSAGTLVRETMPKAAARTKRSVLQLLGGVPRLRWSQALVGVVLLPISSLSIDPDLPFSSGSTGADGPLAFREIPLGRTAPGMAYDAARQEVVMFGGFNGGNGLDDTWVWRGGNWIRLQPATSPPDRWSHKMVWDQARGEIVLFGGTRNTGRLADTWTWNGTTWTQKSPATSPSARDGHAMAYDGARQRVVVFGGNGGGEETWLWNGVTWTQANPANHPPGSASSALAYDPTRQECVFFGNFGQTWTWNGAN